MARDTYSQEQLAALETMKQPGLELGAARPEFVNKALNPDGHIDQDPSAVVARAQADLSRILAIEPKTPAVLRDATRASERLAEIQEHIAQNRFLFVLDDDGFPLIYFQCAVPGNPDVFPPAPAAETSPPPAAPPAQG